MVGFGSSDEVMYLSVQSAFFSCFEDCLSVEFHVGIKSSYSTNEIVSGISFKMSKSSTDVIEGIARSMTNRNPFRCPSYKRQEEIKLVIVLKVCLTRAHRRAIEGGLIVEICQKQLADIVRIISIY